MIENTNKKGELFVISGPSGTGKGTICRRIVGRGDIALSISATTREPRNCEKDGESYYFITREEFEERISNGGFLEYAEVYGNYYGTPRQKVIDLLNAGTDVILEIDIQGAMQVKENYPDGIFIFILPPSLKELRERLTGRHTDSKDVIELRLGKTMEEIRQIGKYDYYILNRNLDEAVNDAEAIIRAEHLRVQGRKESIISMFEEE